jgi:hypothetical protein
VNHRPDLVRAYMLFSVIIPPFVTGNLTSRNDTLKHWLRAALFRHGRNISRRVSEISHFVPLSDQNGGNAL